MQEYYSWGVDGLGRAHIYKHPCMTIIFSMIDGTGLEGVYLLERQDEK